MPETKRIVINTGPLISLVAAMGDLAFLSSLYEQVLVPFEVCREIQAGGKNGFAIAPVVLIAALLVSTSCKHTVYQKPPS